MTVDRKNHVAIAEPDVFGKRAWVDVDHFYPYIRVDFKLRALGIGEPPNCHAELRLSRGFRGRFRNGFLRAKLVFPDDRSLGYWNLEIEMLAVAIDSQQGNRTNGHIGYPSYQIVAVFNGPVIEGQHHIAFLDTRLAGRFFGRCRLNNHPMVEPESQQRIPSVDARAPRNADRSAHNTSIPDDIVINTHRRIRGQRKTNSFIGAAARRNHRIHADHFTADVQQRPAAIPRIDCRIGLNKMLELLLHAKVWQIAPGSAYDARGYRSFQPEGRANRYCPIANLNTIGICKLDGRKLPPGIHFDDGQVTLRVDTHNARTVFRVVVNETDFDSIGFIDHVIIRNNVAVLIDDKPRPAAFLAEGLCIGLAKEPPQHILWIFRGRFRTRIVIIARLYFSVLVGLYEIVGMDVDNGRLQPFRELGEFVTDRQRLRHSNRRCIRGNGRAIPVGPDAGVDERADNDTEYEGDQQESKT